MRESDLKHVGRLRWQIFQIKQKINAHIYLKVEKCHLILNWMISEVAIAIVHLKKSVLLKVIPTFNRASNWVSSWTGNWVGMSHSFCPWTTKVLVPTEGKNHNKLTSTIKKFEYKAWNIEILLSWCFSCYYDDY